MLNINASLTKMGKPYSTIWGEDLTDAFADGASRAGSRRAPSSTTRRTSATSTPARTARRRAADRARLAGELAERMAILGVFDEGCMGMYNAIIDDEHLNPMGIYKERLSQSALVAEMRHVTEREARDALAWLDRRGMEFRLGKRRRHRADRGPGPRPVRLYTAAVRIADRFGCDAIGIQYQQGSRTWRPPRTWPRACSTTPTGRPSATSRPARSSTRVGRSPISTRWTRARPWTRS